MRTIFPVWEPGLVVCVFTCDVMWRQLESPPRRSFSESLLTHRPLHSHTTPLLLYSAPLQAARPQPRRHHLHVRGGEGEQLSPHNILCQEEGVPCSELGTTLGLECAQCSTNRALRKSTLSWKLIFVDERNLKQNQTESCLYLSWIRNFLDKE